MLSHFTAADSRNRGAKSTRKIPAHLVAADSISVQGPPVIFAGQSVSSFVSSTLFFSVSSHLLAIDAAISLPFLSMSHHDVSLVPSVSTVASAATPLCRKDGRTFRRDHPNRERVRQRKDEQKNRDRFEEKDWAGSRRGSVVLRIALPPGWGPVAGPGLRSEGPKHSSRLWAWPG